MEKKPTRSVQPSSKGPLSTDHKKSQDVSSGKLWPRGSRQREPPGGNYRKAEARKPVPQKTKLLDKRPRTRGLYAPVGIPGGGKESAWVEEPELGSVFIPGSKKQSLNHLLNFHYAPRDSLGQTPLANNHGGHKWLSTGKHRYNKEHYIQANCQFIVNSVGDYKQYMNNPDVLVDWSLIEQINLQVNETPSCPICLYPPAAAKMTRCGHIYCWSCILHYLNLSEKTWSKCPICFESIHRQDLKSVVSVSHPSFNVNETITFKLMKRARGSLVAYPADMNVKDDDVPFRMNDDAPNLQCKLLIADSNDVMSIIEREKCELICQLTDQEESGKCFVEEALQLLQKREGSIVTTLAVNLQEVSLSRSRYESYNSDTMYDESGSVVSVSPPNTTSNSNNDRYMYFYQASDGQHIYLHAINAKMLEHTYGSLEYSPRSLTGRIVEKEGGSMTEELRHRLRCLAHLPVTCQFEVAEIQFQSSVISKETADYFAEQVEFRKKRRQKRSREEKRREKKIADEENRQIGLVACTTDIELESQVQFPDFGSACSRERAASESVSSRSASPVSSLAERSVEFAGPSFAKMLSSEKKNQWPDLKSSRANSSLPSAAAVASTPKATKVSSRNNESSDECEDYIPVPEFKQTFGDAIALALERAARSNEEKGELGAGAGGGGGGGKKKKKNKQKKLLFTTAMACSGGN